MTKKLSDLSVGEAAKVVGINNTSPAFKNHLLSLGFVNGTEVRLARKAPFGDPIGVSVRGVKLALRKSEAALIEVN